VPRYKSGGESWWDAKIVRNEGRAGLRHLGITTSTIDTLLASNDRPVTFVKIDAEYHEYECIRGATTSLRRWQPALQIETLETVDVPGSKPHAMAALLSSIGYAPYCFDGTRFHSRRTGQQQQNLFFLTERHRHLL